MKMMNLKESEIINGINIVALNCYQRPILIAIDNATKDYVYYFLLLELEQQAGLLTDTVRQKIENMVFYDVERVYEKVDHLDRTIKNMIDNERYMILCINLYHSKQHTNYYHKEHHWHFCLIKGYEETTGDILLIDEEPGLLYASRTSFNPYKEQRINFDELKFLASNINELLDENEKTDDNSSFVYYEVKIDRDAINHLKENYMLEMYSLMLGDLAEHSGHNEMTYIDGMKQFREKVSNNSYDFASIYPYPDEIAPLLKHIDSLNLQYKVLELVMDKDIFETDIKYLLEKLIARFEIIKKQLIKYFYNKKDSIIDKVIEQDVKGISSDEEIVYRKIIKLIEEGSIRLAYNNKVETINEAEGKNSDKNSKYQYIDVSDLFNSKCFISDVDKCEKIDNVLLGDFIENGELICMDSFVNKTYLISDAFKFWLPQIQEDQYDNVSCCGNSVKVMGMEHAKEIMLLGFSE